MESDGAVRKRGRPDEAANGSGVGSKKQKDTESFQSGLSSKSKACTKFFSTSGCPFGENCHFSHYVPDGFKVVAPTMASMGNLAIGPVRNLMMSHSATISDGPSSTVKAKLCNKYNTAEGCRFGDKCHFAHGERELGRPMLTSHGLGERPLALPVVSGRLGSRSLEPPPPSAGQLAAASFGASATAKISVDASLAGAIIGKGGVNTKQICRLTGAKISIRDHDSDPNLRNIELEGTFEQIGQASTLVKELIVNISGATASLLAPKAPSGNNYKTKICDNFEKGVCSYGERCHFAHGTSELRMPPAA